MLHIFLCVTPTPPHPRTDLNHRSISRDSMIYFLFAKAVEAANGKWSDRKICRAYSNLFLLYLVDIAYLLGFTTRTYAATVLFIMCL